MIMSHNILFMNDLPKKATSYRQDAQGKKFAILSVSFFILKFMGKEKASSFSFLDEHEGSEFQF